MMKKTGTIWLTSAKVLLFAIVLAVFFAGQRFLYADTVFYYMGNYVVLLLYAIILYLTCRVYSCFQFGNIDFQESVISWTLSLTITNAIQYFQLSLQSEGLLPVAGFLIIWVAQIIIIIPLTLCINKFYYFLNPAQKAVIVYGKKDKMGFYHKILQRQSKEFNICHLISQDEPLETLLRHLDNSESVFFLDVDGNISDYLFDYCFRHNKHMYILPTFSGMLLNTAEIIWVSSIPVFLPKVPLLGIGTSFIKRCMDIIISLFAIFLLSWLMLLTAAAIRLYDRNPAIYRQIRLTKDGKRFALYKFRSMRIDSENDGIARLASQNDDRITPIGRFIRKTRIDELPQFFNVLLGDMSLVGPRPERPEIAEQYESIYPNFTFRIKVKAGLTGLAQVYGRYNMAPDEKLFLDIMYIEQFSLLQDIKLIFQTLKVVFKPSSTEGISSGDTTALKLKKIDDVQEIDTHGC